MMKRMMMGMMVMVMVSVTPNSGGGGVCICLCGDVSGGCDGDGGDGKRAMAIK